MHNKRLLKWIIGLTVVGLISWWLYRELRIDSCLDQGGRWNYENSKCES